LNRRPHFRAESPGPEAMFDLTPIGASWAPQKLNPYGLFPHPCGRRDPPDRLRTNVRTPCALMSRLPSANVHSLGTKRSPTDTFPVAQDQRCRGHLNGRLGFLQQGRHTPLGQADVGQRRTVISEGLLRRSGGFQPGSSTVTTTSCRAALITTKYRRPA